MGYSLAEYAALHPETQEQPVENKAMQKSAAEAIQTRQERDEQAARLKESILLQLQQGTDLHIILYSAIRYIGMVSGDDQWQQQAASILDDTYQDIEQQALFVDNEAIAADRRKQQQEAYNAKLRRQVEKQIKGYTQIAKSLNDVLNALNTLDGMLPSDTAE